MEASVGGDDLEKRGASGRNKEGRRGRRAESALGGGPTSKLCVNLLHEEGEPFHVAVVCASVQSRTSREDLVRGGRREGDVWPHLGRGGRGRSTGGRSEGGHRVRCHLWETKRQKAKGASFLRRTRSRGRRARWDGTDL